MLAQLNGLDRIDQLQGRRVLQYVAGRARIQASCHQILVVVDRQDQNLDVGTRLLDPTNRIEPFQHGHGDVHQNDVGIQPDRLLHCLLAVGGFADNLHIRLAGQDGLHTFSKQCVIVTNHNFSSPPGKGRSTSILVP